MLSCSFLLLFETPPVSQLFILPVFCFQNCSCFRQLWRIKQLYCIWALLAIIRAPCVLNIHTCRFALFGQTRVCVFLSQHFTHNTCSFQFISWSQKSFCIVENAVRNPKKIPTKMSFSAPLCNSQRRLIIVMPAVHILFALCIRPCNVSPLLFR